MEPTTVANSPDSSIDVEMDDPGIAQAKESMFARMDELNRRFQSAKEKLDFEAHIAAHPHLAVGISLAVGLLLGSHGANRRERKREERDEPKEPERSAVASVAVGAEKAGVATAVVGIVGTLIFKLVKDVASKHVTGYAKTWWEKQQQAKEARANADAAEAVADAAPAPSFKY